jgi:hypothetical protein
LNDFSIQTIQGTTPEDVEDDDFYEEGCPFHGYYEKRSGAGKPADEEVPAGGKKGKKKSKGKKGAGPEDESNVCRYQTGKILKNLHSAPTCAEGCDGFSEMG